MGRSTGLQRDHFPTLRSPCFCGRPDPARREAEYRRRHFPVSKLVTPLPSKPVAPVEEDEPLILSDAVMMIQDAGFEASARSWDSWKGTDTYCGRQDGSKLFAILSTLSSTVTRATWPAPPLKSPRESAKIVPAAL
jgi:hypothetical protein